MLVFSRKVNETVVVTIPEGCQPGEKIVITVVEALPGKCRLGVDAARHIPVHRGEIATRIAEGVSQQEQP